MAGVEENDGESHPMTADARVTVSNGQPLAAPISNGQQIVAPLSNGQQVAAPVENKQAPAAPTTSPQQSVQSVASQSPAAPTTVRTPEPMTADANYRLVPSATAPAVAPAPTSAPPVEPSHRNFVRPLVILLLLAGLGFGYWWAKTTGWAPPWEIAPGPLAASGTLEADEVLVGSEIPGRIVELVEEGQSVKADEIVAKLDDKLIQLQILQATVAERQKLNIQLDQYQLKAAISGVVTRVPIHKGEVVAPGETVIALADLSELQLTAYVLERDLGEVRVGQPVAVTADPFPGRTFHGVVTSTNPHAEFTPRNIQTQADRLNLVFGVKIRVDNPDGALKPGMPADVTFPPLAADN